MSRMYRLSYLIGLTPWERVPALPEGSRVRAMFDREERGRRPPYGRALDLGCGSGIWSVALAERGWEVTESNLVPKAVRRARERARRAGVEVRLLEGDVTNLRALDIGSGFRLVLDFGVIHGLTAAQREAAGREVTAVAAEGATMLVLAFTPGRRGPLPRGASRPEIEAAFPDWSVIDDSPADMTGAPRPVRRASPRHYTLRHGTAGATPA